MHSTGDNQMVCEVYFPETGITRFVKNLGWLLHHKEEIISFQVYVNDESYAIITGCKAVLYARMNGRNFRAEFQDVNVLREWLKRPSFKGLVCRWTTNAGTDVATL